MAGKRPPSLGSRVLALAALLVLAASHPSETVPSSASGTLLIKAGTSGSSAAWVLGRTGCVSPCWHGPAWALYSTRASRRTGGRNCSHAAPAAMLCQCMCSAAPGPVLPLPPLPPPFPREHAHPHPHSASLQGGTVVNHDRQWKADVLVRDGLIVSVHPSLQARARGWAGTWQGVAWEGAPTVMRCAAPTGRPMHCRSCRSCHPLTGLGRTGARRGPRDRCEWEAGHARWHRPAHAPGHAFHGPGHVRRLCQVVHPASMAVRAPSDARGTAMHASARTVRAAWRQTRAGGPRDDGRGSSLPGCAAVPTRSGQAAAAAGGTTMHIDFALPVDYDLARGFEEWRVGGAAGPLHALC